MKITIIGTIASSLYKFIKYLILSLINRCYTSYAFTSDSDEAEITKIAQLMAFTNHYEISRGGLNPYQNLINTNKLYQ